MSSNMDTKFFHLGTEFAEKTIKHIFYGRHLNA